jgi:branched-chain amino acid transport system permease protein
MIGSYIGYFVLTWLGGAADPSIPVVATIALMFLAAMLGAGALGVVIERFAYRPLREKRAARISPLISALGVSFFLQQLAVILFGSAPKQYNSFAFDGGSLFTNVTIGPFTIQYMQLFVIVTTVCLMAALTIFIARTQVGRAMRATSFDLEAASMMGINVDRVIVVTFFIGSVLAGAAGVMNGLIFQNVDPYVGFQVGLVAFTAAVVGGIGSIPGAMIGGLAIGIGRAFSIGYVSSSYQDVIVFAILIGVLLMRPSGLFGTPAPQKV